MRVTVIGKNINVTPALKEIVEKKISKLDKYFEPNVTARATLTVQKNSQIFEVTIPFNGVVLRCEESTDDMYKSIDLVENKLERQIRKQRTKLQRRNNESLRFGNFDEVASEEDDNEGEIVKVKRFNIKCRTFPSTIVAKIFNFSAKPMFEVQNEAERENVKVSF